MRQMTHWIPEGWREALANLRDDIYDIAERWLPWRRGSEATHKSNVPVRYAERTDATETFWATSWRSSVMALDETDNDVVVTAELPGLEPEDFAVEVTGERMVIRGEKKYQSSHSSHGYRYSERRYGAFARALRLPCEVDVGQAKANYKRGVLRVTLPKTARAKASRVKIQVHG